MNLYNYWLRIKGMYPTAVADCVSHFQQSHPQDWRDHFQDPDQILAYLERRRIHIITRKREEHQIRFELKAYEETTVTAFHFTSRETALYDAIERAFRILEQRELRRLANGGEQSTRRRKAKPQPTYGPSWGEQVKKQEFG
ncbi:MAG: hypothetical protein K9J37_19715 [Saprospiraceae bacterium]|nr:hypothetical protein [Saprospiraceae bacterium]MCF8252154.1 hypothetical protein [Saprospiraceae bacterium]MCF8282437.1 hypothetical protein [Bacteroidales bacterium]MCF8313823.1 hypothetical protein [Saprospiraceae bacterium]MCF8442529.1 hypothetical protein [Saprospiraceae bacterium]